MDRAAADSARNTNDAPKPKHPPTPAASLPEPLYRELRQVAAALLRRERSDHTLQPTALVHEFFLRMRGQVDVDRAAETLGQAAATMRRILVDHARRRAADKRGAGRLRVAFDESLVVSPEPLELLALDEALRALAALDERKARVVELRFFGGLTDEEAADVLGIARSTADADWFMARAWLRRKLAGHDS